MQYKVFSLLEPTPGKIVEFEKEHPRLMKLFEPMGKFLAGFVETHTTIVLDKYETLAHPQEDYLKVSETFPIFAVADGVTLEFNPDGTYPNPSGAGEVSKIFCETIVRELEHCFNTFTPENLRTVFRTANAAVGDYNRSHGRTTESSNFMDHDLFACTAAVGVFKEGMLYYASVCDCFAVYFNAQGRQIEKSPVCWPHERQHKYLPPDWEKRPDLERKKTIRKVYRNGVNTEGLPIGYGVVTGESAVEQYVNTGEVKTKKGDVLFLVSDGFEPYLALSEFVALFKEWPVDLETKVRAITEKMGNENPGMFAHERSIVAVSFN